jgi:hypothetical protein
MLCGLIFRLTVGVDFGDESFYIVVAKSMMAWGHPFVMNATLAQTAAWILIPFIQLWHLIGMDDGGLVLWLRMVYLATNCLCAGILFLAAKARLDSTRALLVALLPLVWVPFGLPALSYNTMGESGFLCGLLLYCYTREDKSFWLSTWVATILFAISCVAYPPMAFPCVVFLAARIITAPDPEARKRRICSIGFFAAAGLTLLFLAALLCGPENLLRSFSIVNLIGASYKQHMGEIIAWEFSGGNFSFLFFVCILTAIAQIPKDNVWLKTFSMVIFALVLSTTACLSTNMQAQSHPEIILLSIFLIPTMILGKKIPIDSKLAFFSSVLAGTTFAFSSSNGPTNYPLGAFPAVCIGMSEFIKSYQTDRSKALRIGAIMIPSVSVLVIFLSSLTAIYNDGDIGWKDRVSIPSGPFRWLKTSPSKKFLLSEITSDLAQLSKQYKTIYVIGQPAYYLCTSLKPLDLLLFHYSYKNNLDAIRPYVEKFYEANGYPDLILLVDDPSFGQLSSLDQEILEHHYSKIIAKSNYRIYCIVK